MKDIIDYEGIYQITESGEVYSIGRSGTKGGFVKTRANKDGYVLVYLSKNDSVKTHKLHRIVAVNLIPNPNPSIYKYVNHKDGNKQNNHPSNLEWCTAKENIRHAWETGLSKALKGESNGSSKLTNVQRIEIVKLYAMTNLAQPEIAKMFNITQTNVAIIVRAYLRQHFNTMVDIDTQNTTP